MGNFRSKSKKQQQPNLEQQMGRFVLGLEDDIRIAVQQGNGDLIRERFQKMVSIPGAIPLCFEILGKRKSQKLETRARVLDDPAIMVEFMQSIVNTTGFGEDFLKLANFYYYWKGDCPAECGLSLITVSAVKNYSCDGCLEKISNGKQLYGCETCAYYECKTCYASIGIPRKDDMEAPFNAKLRNGLANRDRELLQAVLDQRGGMFKGIFDTNLEVKRFLNNFLAFGQPVKKEPKDLLELIEWLDLPPIGNCSGKHGLGVPEVVQEGSGFHCQGCAKLIRPNKKMYRCKDCNWTECLRCYTKANVRSRAQEAVMMMRLGLENDSAETIQVGLSVADLLDREVISLILPFLLHQRKVMYLYAAKGTQNQKFAEEAKKLPPSSTNLLDFARFFISPLGDCPAQHGLVLQQLEGYSCSGCFVQIAKGEFYSCRICEYDECQDCHAKALDTRAMKAFLQPNSDKKKNDSIFGIRLSHLQSLVNDLAKIQKIPLEKRETFNFYDLVEFIVKPQTEHMEIHEDRSYVSYLQTLEDGENVVGLAEVFVSYAWKGNCIETVQALMEHFTERDPVLFIDCMCLDQHQIGETNGKLTFKELGENFKKKLETIGEAVILLTPGSQPIAVTRAWCCFEWTMITKLEIPFSYSVPKKDSNDFIDLVETGKLTLNYFDAVFSNINVMQAEASNSDDQRNIRELIRIVGEKLVNNVVLDNVKQWPMDVCLANFHNPSTSPKSKVLFTNALGLIYQALGKFDEAKTHFQAATESARLLNEPELLVKQLNDLAILFVKTGEITEGKKFMEEAISVVKKVQMDETFEEISLTLATNLAAVLIDLSEYAEAETFLREGIATRRERIKGSDTSKPRDEMGLASSLSSLGDLLGKQGKFGEALPLLKESLEIHEKFFGRTHPLYAESLSNVAAVLVQMEDPTALWYLEKSVEIIKNLKGEDHPSLAGPLNSLALLSEKQGNLEKAEEYFRQSLALLRKNFGNTHPNVPTSLLNLGTLMKAKKDYEAAESLIQESIQVTKMIFGENQPNFNLAYSMFNLALLFQITGKIEQARHLAKESQVMLLKLVGPTDAKYLACVEFVNSLG